MKTITITKRANFTQDQGVGSNPTQAGGAGALQDLNSVLGRGNIARLPIVFENPSQSQQSISIDENGNLVISGNLLVQGGVTAFAAGLTPGSWWDELSGYISSGLLWDATNKKIYVDPDFVGGGVTSWAELADKPAWLNYGTLAEFQAGHGHDASKITESATKRFVTDAEKATWNSKLAVESDTLQSVTDRGNTTTHNIDIVVNELLQFRAGISSGNGGYMYLVDANDTRNIMFRSYGDSYFLNNLGIGTSSPAEKLDVNGNIKLSGDIIVNNWTIKRNTTSNNLEFWYGGAKKATLTSAGDFHTVGNLAITGNLDVQGTTTYLNTTQVNIEDNLILINSNQTGTPSSALMGGIEVERGDLTNYQFLFEEASDLFKIGMAGDLQAVATREDSPLSGGFAKWNSAARRFDAVNLAAGDIPSLDAAKIATGVFAAARIPSLAISKITGLQTALDAKFDKAGGTITGNLAITGNLIDIVVNELLQFRAGISSGNGGYMYLVDANDTRNIMFRSYGDSYFLNNLGIGTSSPAEKLDVKGNIKLSGDIIVNNWTIKRNTTSNNLEFWYGGAKKATLTSAGDFHTVGDVIAYSTL